MSIPAKLSFKSAHLRLRWLLTAPLALVILIAALALSDSAGPALSARETLFDFFQRIAPREATAGEARTVMIEIDRESLDRLGPWPWPRTRIAALVTALAEAEAAAIIVDVPLMGEDALSPENVGPIWLQQNEDDELAAAIARAPRHDAVLAQALAAAPAVLTFQALPQDRANEDAPADLGRSPAIQASIQPFSRLPLPAAAAAAAPNSELVQAAESAAASGFLADHDGLIRRTPLIWSLSGAARPNMIAEAARRAQSAEAIRVEAEASSLWGFGATIGKIEIGDTGVETYPDGSMRLHLPAALNPTSLPAWRVLSGETAPSFFRGHYAIVGLTAPELKQSLPTARGPVEKTALTALAMDQYLSGAALTRPNWMLPLEAGLALVFGALAVVASQRFSVRHSFALAFAVALLAVFGAWMAFDQGRLLFDPWPTTVAVLVAALAVAGGRGFKEIMDHEAVRGAFNDSLPATAVAALADGGPRDLLEGARRVVTVMNCEIRSAETHEEIYADNPAALTRLIRTVTTHMRSHILQCGGAVDQIEGGRLAGIWNAPLEDPQHPQAACACALSLIESLDSLNGDLEEAAELAGLPFTPVHLGIGVATGECYVGAIAQGAQTRYSAIGDAVDIAAHLRARSKLYGPAIIVDEGVYRESHHRFAYLEVDLLEFPGHERADHVYALLGNPFIKASPRYRAVDEAQRNILAAFRAGEWTEAQALLAEARELKGANPAIFDLYERRIRRYISAPPPENWVGAEFAYA